MPPEKRREIASRGGKAAHAKGTAHTFSTEEAKLAGRRGGEAVSADRAHMAKIGQRGGRAVSNDRAHMAELGKRGGEAISQDREYMAAIGRKGGLSRSIAIPEGVS